MTAVIELDDLDDAVRALIARVEAGEELVIAREGREVALVIPLAERKRTMPFGWARGMVQTTPGGSSR